MTPPSHDQHVLDWLAAALQDSDSVHLSLAGTSPGSESRLDAPSGRSAAMQAAYDSLRIVSKGFKRRNRIRPLPLAPASFTLPLGAPSSPHDIPAAASRCCAWHVELQAAIVGPQLVCFQPQRGLCPAHVQSGAEASHSLDRLLLLAHAPGDQAAPAWHLSPHAGVPGNGSGAAPAAARPVQRRSLRWGHAQHALPGSSDTFSGISASLSALQLSVNPMAGSTQGSGPGFWSAEEHRIGQCTAWRRQPVLGASAALLPLLRSITVLTPTSLDPAAVQAATRQCQVSYEL